jgi:hypothetical protein
VSSFSVSAGTRAGKLTRYRNRSVHDGALLSRLPFKRNCNPYAAFGTLDVDLSHPEGNKWRPFDTTCSPPSYLAQLRSRLLPNSLYPRDGSRFSSVPNVADLPWLHNRTVLLIGDAVTREHVENFCQLLGLEAEVVRKSHKYAPGLSIQRNGQDKPARLAERKAMLGGSYRVVRDASYPRLCYVPQYDFMVRSALLSESKGELICFSPTIAGFNFPLWT